VPHRAARIAILNAFLCLGLLGLAGRALAQCTTGWLDVTGAGPGNRRFLSMTYDSIRHRLVLFGGTNQFGQMRGDTWEWDGTSWTQVATTGPDPRYSYSMAFDSQRGVVVLFGGGDVNQTFRDTWEWNGTTWTLRTSSGPGPRIGAGMAFDEARGVTVLYGGDPPEGGHYADTWTWDGAGWTLQSSASPPGARGGVKLSYDPSRQRTVLFGGNGPGFRSDTWEWDGSQWTSMNVTGPSARMDYCLAYDAARGVTLLYGGYNGVSPTFYLDDAWEWNGSSWTLAASGGPGARSVAAMGYDTAHSRMILYGGSGPDPTQTWAWLGPPLQITQAPSASSVSCGSPASFSVGATGPGTLSYQWRRGGTALADDGRITGSKTASLSISATALADQGSYDVVVSSACGSLAAPAAALTVNPTSASITQQPTAQSVTCGQTATFTVAVSGTPPFAYQWRRNGVALTNDGHFAGVTTATLSINPAFVQDAGSFSVVVSAGCASATSNSVDLGVGAVAPTFTLNPSDQVSSCGQAVSFTANATSVGGLYPAWRHDSGDFLQDDGRLSGTHSLTLTIDPVLPSDAGTYTCVVGSFCGQTNSNAATLTIPSSMPEIVQQPTRSVAALEGSASFTVNAVGSAGMSYQWRHDGANLADGGNISGSGTATLTVNPVNMSDVGFYDVTVSNFCGTTQSSAFPLVLADCDPLWQLAATSGPGPRSFGAMVYDSQRKKVVLFGGGDPVGHPLGDTWEWDGATWTQVATTGPSPRFDFAMSYDSGRGKVVLFGGENSTTPFNDTWEWDGTTWTQVETGGPSARLDAAMAYDEATGVTLLFGGDTQGGGLFGETWQWNGTVWSFVSNSGPSPRTTARMVYDSARHRIVLFGGVAPVSPHDTWEWDGTQWIDRGATGPPARRAPGMAYDVARGVTVVYGGISPTNTYLDDTWEWDGAQWMQVSSSGPGARTFMYMSSGPGHPLLVGGSPAGYDGKTWSWASPAPPSFATQPVSQTVVIGQTATISAAIAAGGGPITYQWSRESTPLQDGGNISGATTPTLAVSSVGLADEGYYSVAVSGVCGSTSSTAARLRAVCGSAPSISQQPADLLVAIGTGANWTVAASGCLSPTYQWRKNDVPIPGATSAGYSIASVGAGDAGLYSVEISAGGLTTVSREATLNVDPGPVFVAFYAQAPDPNGVQVSWTLRDAALVRVEYGATPALGSTLTDASPGTGGTLLVPRGSLTTFYYRLVAVDALNLTAATPVAQVIFPPSVYKLTVVATPYPTWVSFNGPNLGAKVTITATNMGNVPIGGRIQVIGAKLGKASPKLLSGVVALPVTVANGLALNGVASVDLLFKRNDIGSAAGAQVTFTASIRWTETSAPNAPVHTLSLTQKVRLPK
jgi:hypothetical protein